MTSRSEALRQALEACAGALALLRLPRLTAEDLRKAKFGQAEVPQQTAEMISSGAPSKVGRSRLMGFAVHILLNMQTDPLWRVLHDMSILYALWKPAEDEIPCHGLNFWKSMANEAAAAEIPQAGRMTPQTCTIPQG